MKMNGWINLMYTHRAPGKAKFTMLQVISGAQGGIVFSLRPDEGNEPEDA